MKLSKLIIENLEDAYNYDPKNPTLRGEKAKENMHYAAAIAGMAFGNAFLGINHSLAHKTGGEFGLPHGLAISIAMQHVIRYNAVSGNVKRSVTHVMKNTVLKKITQILRVILVLKVKMMQN